MIQLIKTDTKNAAFRSLLIQLDANLKANDGDEHWFFAQFNKLDDIKHVVVVYENSEPIGCGALKKYDAQRVEIKRVFVIPSQRNKGIASRIIQELEGWAKELGFKECILETGIKQKEAVHLYPKLGYSKIENYEPYIGVSLSVCFAKSI